MKPGDIVITNHVRQIISRDTRFEISEGKKENFVFIFLGTESKDGSKPLDPVKRLNELGWELGEESEL